MVSWHAPSWGVVNHVWHGLRVKRRRFAVVFGDDEKYSFSGHFKTRRRAKKEITHYISRGLHRGPFRGAYRHLKSPC